jgi:DNA (cytosine-5)-methyltransferase 1
MIQLDPTFRFADLFCGAGGFTSGAERSGIARGVLAINHWRPAVSTHRQNHPHVRHVCATIDHVDPRDFEGQGINMILASPECIYHSVARGGRPVEDQRRATAWCVPRWLEALQPAWAIIENVREFVDWGPLGTNKRPTKTGKGQIFQAWVGAIRALGYHVEWKLLNAADFGGATKRVRLFVVCRRGRSCKPIPWPAPTHSKANWTPAWKIIDWSRPCPSIFDRKRPLAPKTLARIEAGLRKFCRPELVEPFLVKMRGTNNAASVNEPTPALTAGGTHLGLALPFQLKAAGRNPGQTKPITEPLPTVLGRENHSIVVPFVTQFHNGPDGANRNYPVTEPVPTLDTQNRYGVVAPFIVPNFGERPGQEPRTHSVGDPLPAATGHGAGALVAPFLVDVHNHRRDHTATSINEPVPTIVTKPGTSVVFAFLTSYFGTGHPQPVTEPLTTLTTKDRHGLALVRTMRELGIVDIGFRMLDVDELAAAMGFEPAYYLHGTKAEQVKQVGNAVHTAVARALVEAIGN